MTNFGSLLNLVLPNLDRSRRQLFNDAKIVKFGQNLVQKFLISQILWVLGTVGAQDANRQFEIAQEMEQVTNFTFSKFNLNQCFKLLNFIFLKFGGRNRKWGEDEVPSVPPHFQQTSRFFQFFISNFYFLKNISEKSVYKSGVFNGLGERHVKICASVFGKNKGHLSSGSGAQSLFFDFELDLVLMNNLIIFEFVFFWSFSFWFRVGKMSECPHLGNDAIFVESLNSLKTIYSPWERNKKKHWLQRKTRIRFSGKVSWDSSHHQNTSVVALNDEEVDAALHR